MLLALLGLATTAHADGLDGLHERLAALSPIDTKPGVEVLDARGHVGEGVCFAPIGGTTAEDATLRCEIDGRAPYAVPVFHRLHDMNANSWSVDVSAALRRSSWRGNAMFAFYDADDQDAVAADRYAALYQADVERSKELNAHVHLSPASGFVPGHTYHMRIQQMIHGDTVVLAEADLRLE